MVGNKKRVRELRARIRSHQDEQDALRRAMAGESNKNRRSELTRDLRDRTHTVEILESDLIVEQAQQLGIELEKSSWWLDDVDPDDPGGPPPEYAITRWLSPLGNAVATRRIREERRKDIEWKVKLIVTILTALTGIGGILIGILAFLKTAR
jgi:hypothetical protein